MATGKVRFGASASTAFRRYRSCAASLLLAATGAAAGVSGKEGVLTSPDGRIVASVTVNGEGRLTHSVSMDGRVALEPSPLGITVDGRDLGKGGRLGVPKMREFSESYPFAGNHARVVNNFREAVWPILDAGDGKELMRLEVRAFDDGVAYRYRLPAAEKRRIAGESSSWTIPAGATVWYQAGLSYENPYTTATADAIPAGQVVCLPVTAKLAAGGYVMLTEANLFNYTDLAVKSAGGRRLAAFFHADKDGFEQSGEGVTPWRVTPSPDCSKPSLSAWKNAARRRPPADFTARSV